MALFVSESVVAKALHDMNRRGFEAGVAAMRDDPDERFTYGYAVLRVGAWIENMKKGVDTPP